MKNYWLEKVRKDELPVGPVCVVLRGSKSKIYGRVSADLTDCLTLADCFDKAIKYCEQLKCYIGETEEMTLVSERAYNIWTSFLINEQKLAEKTFHKWIKPCGFWVSVSKSISERAYNIWTSFLIDEQKLAEKTFHNRN